MVDISDPLNPTFAGCAVIEDADGNDETESNNYVHDVECVVYRGPDRGYRGREICFGSNENVVAIYDVTDKSNPRALSLTGYETAAYTHQGWLTPDQRWFLFGDELDEQQHGQNTTTYIMRAADLDSPGTPKPFLHETRSIDHNLYIHGNRVYESNYMAGLRILEYDKRSLARGQLREVAFFDVVPALDEPEFAGTWSNYRFPGSGITVVSAIENEVSGLFVLRPQLGK
jgi:choice-of-anchor B domain-containing protein